MTLNIEKMREMGGREWSKGDHHRVYFDFNIVAKLYGYDHITKKVMRDCQDIYYNVNDDTFYMKYDMSKEVLNKVAKTIREKCGTIESRESYVNDEELDTFSREELEDATMNFY